MKFSTSGHWAIWAAWAVVGCGGGARQGSAEGEVEATSEARQALTPMQAIPQSVRPGPYAAGAVAGDFSINGQGQATYNIGIRVPPGTAGMQPTLSLSYSSGAGNGIAGNGWTLQGLSSIHRCAATLAQDGVAGSVRYDASDKFCLDGARLTLVGQSAASNGKTVWEYRTELEGFSRIYATGSAKHNPDYWEVHSKAGLVSYLGATADSRAVGPADVCTGTEQVISAVGTTNVAVPAGVNDATFLVMGGGGGGGGGSWSQGTAGDAYTGGGGGSGGVVRASRSGIWGTSLSITVGGGGVGGPPHQGNLAAGGGASVVTGPFAAISATGGGAGAAGNGGYPGRAGGGGDANGVAGSVIGGCGSAPGGNHGFGAGRGGDGRCGSTAGDSGSPGQVRICWAPRIGRAWALSRVVDRKGNYMTVTYQNDTDRGEMVPLRIAYTGNDNVPGQIADNQRIEFYYDPQNRPDPTRGYAYGDTVQNTVRLSRVRSLVNRTEIAAELYLAYTEGSSGRSLLSQVQECGTEACLAPTAFTYAPSAPTIAAPTSWGGGHGLEEGTGDFDGDGRTDLYDIRNGQAFVSLSSGSTFAAPAAWSGGTGFGTDRKNIFAIDVNLDGRTDLLQFDTSGVAKVWLASGSSATTFSFVLTSRGPNAPTTPTQVLTGWQKIPATGLPQGSYEFLYHQASTGNWYKSPTGSVAWSWNGFSPLCGTYTWGLANSPNASGSMTLTNREAGTYGVGCSNGGGAQQKLLPWSTTAPNASASQGIVCQDTPKIFGGACASVDLYYRPYVERVYNFGPDPKRLILGDVDGDSRVDVLRIDASGKLYAFLHKADGFQPGEVYGSDWAGVALENIKQGDFDGDGLTDLLVLESDGRLTVWNAKRAGARASWGQVPAGYAVEFQITDANGDNKDDIVRTSTDGNAYIALSTGRSFEAQRLALAGAKVGDMAMDVSGDGRPDLVRVDGATGQVTWARGQATVDTDSFAAWAPLFSTSPLLTTIANPTTTTCSATDAKNYCVNQGYLGSSAHACGTRTGSCYTSGYQQICPQTTFMSSVTCTQKYGLLMGDPNGDGKGDPILITQAGNALVAAGQNPNPDALTKIVDGRFRERNIVYAPTTRGDTYARLAPAPTYPNVPVTGAMQVVQALGESDGHNGLRWSYFQYFDATSDAAGRGFLGFRSMNASRTAKTGTLVKTTQYAQAFPYTGQTETITEYWLPNGTWNAAQLLSSSINTYATRLYASSEGPPRHFVYTARTEANRKELDGTDLPSTVSVFTYDNDGNLTRTVQSVGPRGGPAYRFKTIDNTYAPGMYGRLTRATVTYDVGDQNTAERRVRTSAFDYDSAGFLIRETVEPNDANAMLVTETTYDAYGNKVSSTQRDTAGRTRTRANTYDSQGRFVVAATDAMGHRTTAETDPRTGNTTKTIDPNGLVTTATYDWQGRVRTETNPFGQITTHTYSTNASNEVPRGLTGFSHQAAVQNGAGTMTGEDVLGRVRQSAKQGADGRWIYTDYSYDAYGNLTSQSLPHFDNQSPLWTTFDHDVTGRVTKAVQANGATSTHGFSGLTETVTNALGQTTRRTVDAMGQVARVQDALGGVVTFTYDAVGNVAQSTDPAGNVTTMRYDLRGRRTEMRDPNMGLVTTTYDAFGDLVTEITPTLRANAKSKTMTYDALGRLARRDEAGEVTTWTYDTCAYGKGKLCSVTGPSMNYRREFTYNDKSLVASDYVTISSWVVNTWTTTTTYDAAGRPARMRFPTGFSVENRYSGTGYLWQVADALTGTALYTQNETDAWGSPTKETFGNGLVTRSGFHAQTHALESVRSALNDHPTVSVHNQRYTWDALGNMIARQDLQNGLAESFTYDGIDRLKAAYVTQYNWAAPGAGAPANVTLDYDATGNITFKSDVGAYAYNALRPGTSERLPHAVSTAGTRGYTYDESGNVKTGNGMSIAWKPFDMVEWMEKSSSTTAVGAFYAYGPDHQRIVHRRSTRPANSSTWSNVDETYYVSPNYEETRAANGKVTQRHYVFVGSATLLHTRETQSGSTVSSTRYLLKDHLGSFTTVTDQAGSIITAESFSFDIFGQRRRLKGDPLTTTSPSLIVNRGYTGHEMLSDFGLVHMNGRLQDPVLARFLSADPFIQYPELGQSHNRYSYLNNNPLNATDPTGYFSLKRLFQVVAVIAIVVAAVYFGPVLLSFLQSAWALTGLTLAKLGIAAAIGGTLGYAQTGSLKGAVKGAVMGMASAAVFGACGQLAGGQLIPKMLLHGVGNGTLTAIQGGDFATGFMMGMGNALLAGTELNPGPIGAFGDYLEQNTQSFMNGAAGGAIAAAIVGGVQSKLMGGSFQNGASSAAYAYLFNRVGDKMTKKLEAKHESSEPQGDYIDRLAQCVDSLDPLSPVAASTATAAGGALPKAAIGRGRGLAGASRFTTVPSVAAHYLGRGGLNVIGSGAGTAGAALRTMGRIASPVWVGYGVYMAGVEASCATACAFGSCQVQDLGDSTEYAGHNGM